MKKLMALLVCIAMMAVSLGVLAEETPTLVMATNASFPPYEYYDGDAIVGIDAEIPAAVCEKMG